MTKVSLQSEISEQYTGKRLDQVLASLYPDYSRARIQNWIKQGFVKVNKQPILKSKAKVFVRDQVIIEAELSAEIEWQAEDIPIDVVHEDDDIIVINKNAGLVVHPAAGNWNGTLVNALLNHCPDLEQLPRAGIVHRLDKDTTGLMVVAKSIKAHTHLITALSERTVNRQYLCVVNGALTAGGTVEQPIGRHPTKRKQMTVIGSGKYAVTHYRIEQRFKNYTYLRVKLETGRTHQIRVHMNWLKHPLVGDPVYGGRLRQPAGTSQDFLEKLKSFKRQALHATKLGLTHPTTQETMSWTAEIPEDMESLLEDIHLGEQNL